MSKKRTRTAARVERRSDGTRYRIAINHGPVPLAPAGTGLELLTGESASGSITVPAGAVRVLRSAEHRLGAPGGDG